MEILIISIWALQGVFMFFDEFIFHRRRGLGKWERLGHPVDSFFFLLPFIYTLWFSNEYVFIALSLFSCLLVTKDEFVHAKECDPYEQWLHALLFIIHPIALTGLWLAWKADMRAVIIVQSIIITAAMSYQIIYWNLYAKNRVKAKA